LAARCTSSHMTQQHAHTATVTPGVLINGLSSISAPQLKFLTVNCNYEYNVQFHFYLLSFNGKIVGKLYR